MNTLTISLDNLFFDPNNYRLRSNQSYKYISSGSVLSPTVQKKTNLLISGSANKNIRDLVESIKANGYLKVDNVLVRKIRKDAYLVVEGNRRLAALKFLKDQKEKGGDIGKLDPNIFKQGIEVVLYDYENEKDYLVLMGLKHVSGNKKWDRYNQAKLLYELKKELKLTDGVIAAKIGIRKDQVQKEIRGYLATEIFIKEMAGEDIPDFNPYEKIMIMIELTNKPKIRKWVGWDDTKEKFSNKENLSRFFSWVAPASEYDEDSEEYTPLDPILQNHKQVRLLEELINDEEALELMEEQRSLEFALDQNVVFTKKQFSSTIKKVEKILRNVKAGSSLNLTAEDKKVLNIIMNIVKKLLA